MFADIRIIAENTLMVEGKNPKTFLVEPDISHILLHKANDTLYILDTGATPLFRQKLIGAAQSLRPFSKIKLLNSHGHPDHTGNNSVLHELKADAKQHLISRSAYQLLDYEKYFLADFRELGQAFYFLKGLDYHPEMLNEIHGQSGFLANDFVNKLNAIVTLADELHLPEAINSLFPPVLVELLLRNFHPLEPSVETMRAFEETESQQLNIAGVNWSGWNIDDNIFVLESRGHSPDGLIFYLPKVKLLYCGDESTVIPLFRDSNSSRARSSMNKCLRMVEAGSVDILLDSHHQLFTSQQQMLSFLHEMIEAYDGLKEIILGILKTAPAGLSIEKIYDKIKQLDHPALVGLFAWQFPVFAVFVKQLIYRYLLEMRCGVRGHGHDRLFFAPTFDET